ncbi:molybdenum cofactor biosynthesis protein MoaE [Geoglobus acetivorans]|uniref:Molybdenum cofactor biosynthesis protein MoaE n=1 Tax=Geoglobus acetivorans TaxID=565033 RepID=A0A0A7GDX2_GEOAI|nr:Molybdenum cofactor biosynthesis protein MoaE [Geoglobus acetivorans]
MKVCIVSASAEKIAKELEKKGKAIVIEKGNPEGEKVLFGENCVSFTVKPRNLRDVLEVLADLGYDYALLKGFMKEEVENLGIEIPEIESAEEAETADDCETIKSIMRKLKESAGAEFSGAIGVFVGFVRRISDGREVVRLEYEKYDELFDRVREEIEQEILGYDGVRGVRIYHRVGTLVPGEDIVYVAVMAEHRKHLWEPLKKAVGLFKAKLPVWKKEIYIDGEIWAHDRDLMKE